MFTFAMIFSAVLLAAVIALLRYHRKRQRLYRALAQERAATVARFPPRMQACVDPAVLRAQFENERIIRVDNFLCTDSLARLRAEIDANRNRVERSYLPGHKKGGTLSYENIQRHAPACLAVYHLQELHDWLSAVVGSDLRPTRDHDQSSCSVLYYTEAGDHIHWHYDHNFYKGRHFTVLLSVVNRSASGTVSCGTLMRKARNGEVTAFDTSENTLIMFEGAEVLHRASPVAAGDLRVMLSMTFCTDARIGVLREVARRIKDTAFFGLRVLVD